MMNDERSSGVASSTTRVANSYWPLCFRRDQTVCRFVCRFVCQFMCRICTPIL